MKTLVISAPDQVESMSALITRRPFPLMTIMGRELLAYQLDLASSFGAEEVVVLSDDRPELVRRFVGTGARWGLDIVVMAVEPGLPIEVQLRRTGLFGRPVTVLAADALVPPLELDGGVKSAPENDWMDRHGWVLISIGDSIQLRFAEDGSLIQHEPEMIEDCRRINSPQALYATHMELFRNPHRLVVPGFEVVPGVTVARGSKFSLGAVVDAPVHISANARVSYRANLGPEVAVGPRCIIDADAQLKNTIVMSGTYVGSLLEAETVILDGQMIINGHDGTVAVIGDDFLLADLERSILNVTVSRWLNRAIGLVLAIAATPILLVAWLFSRRSREETTVFSHRIRRRVDGEVERLRMNLRDLNVERPAVRWAGRLRDVIAGRLALVGNPPLEVGAQTELAPALVERWLSAPIGLFGLAQSEWLRREDEMELEELATTAALYAGTRSTSGDFLLLLRGLCSMAFPRSWKRRHCDVCVL